MNFTYNIKIRTAFWAMLVVVCFVSTAMAAEPAWWTQKKSDCNLPSNLAYNSWDGICSSSSGPGSGGEYNGPNLWNILRNIKNSAADKADKKARAANELGVEAYKKGDWATAAAYFKQALQNYPDDPTYRENFANAQTRLLNQQEKEKAEKQNKAAAASMQQSIQNFAQSLNAAPISGGLDFDGRTSGTAPAGNSGGLDFTATVTPPGKSAATLSGDPMVVDARNVPSGLDQATENAIAKAYANAPPGVSERVRKGFQAVKERDWKVAKTWFEDALNRDPGNPGLQRLVVLADDSLQHGVAPVVQTLPAGRVLQLPTDADVEFFMMLDNPSLAPTPKSDGRVLQLPTDADVLLMFPGEPPASLAPARQPDGRALQLPTDADVLLMFPGEQ